MSRVLKRMAALAVAAPLTATLLVSAGPAGAADGPVARPDLAAGWLAEELDASEGVLKVTFPDGSDPDAEPDVYDDQGLTIDAILALLAAGHGDDPAVAGAVDAVDAVLGGYTGTAYGESYAGATAKALLLQQILGEDLGGTVDLEANLRALLATSGDEQGRFKDVGFYGDFSNGLGQALAVLALDRTSGGVPADAVTWLLAQQCTDGTFRLYYTTGFACASNAEGDTDATALALSALLTQPSSTAVDGAIADAVDALLAKQQDGGGFLGTGAVNANSTGLASAALRAVGETDAADDGAAFVAGLQIADCADADLGATAYSQSAFDAGIDADRGQWTRAAAQGSLALGLPDYGGIGTVAPVAAGLAPVDCTPVAPPPAKPSASASAASVVAGGVITVTGTGFAPGETVSIELHSTPIALGTAVADAQGTVTQEVTIPSDVEPGSHTIVLTGQTSGVTASVAVEVTAPAETGRALPATGTATGAEALFGAGLVVLGAGLVQLGRVRRSRALLQVGR